jgi:hypothetical protein
LKITFETITTVPAGIALKLSFEQADSRRHNLEAFGKHKGVFTGTQALQFKAGETVDIVGDLPKGLLPIYDRLRKTPEAELEFIAETTLDNNQ